MAKKSRRARAKQRTTAARPAADRPAPEQRATPAAPQSPTRVPSRVQDSASRYEYVMPELKRIGIIAGVIFLVLIILSFTLG